MLLFSCSVVSDSLWPHGLQLARLLCTSLSPGVFSNSCPLSQWCIPISHHLLSPSPPAFNLSQYQDLFQRVSSSHQVMSIIGASASASVFPKNIQDWFPLGLTGLISLQSKLLSKVFSNTTVQNCQFFSAPPSYMTTGKTIALTIWTFVGKVMSLLFNMLSRFVIAFLPRRKHLLISRL